ncbi:hypothetical protein T492DRAFT_425747 [Pavlovales sp. CCMP2436]|nr:hypothetical protein T492DRAFT_425747 [Pavlovales sp. CCMP2436]
MMDRVTQTPRGFGFVTYAEPSIAQRVVRLQHVVDGRQVEVKIAVPRAVEEAKLPPQLSPLAPALRKIFVGGLSHDTGEDEFREYFSRWGHLVDCVVMLDPATRRPRGFGFVTYEHVQSADLLCEATNAGMTHELRGKLVEVKRAIPQERAKSATKIAPSCAPRRPADELLRSWAYTQPFVPAAQGPQLGGAYIQSPLMRISPVPK